MWCAIIDAAKYIGGVKSRRHSNVTVIKSLLYPLYTSLSLINAIPNEKWVFLTLYNYLHYQSWGYGPAKIATAKACSHRGAQS